MRARVLLLRNLSGVAGAAAGMRRLPVASATMQRAREFPPARICCGHRWGSVNFGGVVQQPGKEQCSSGTRDPIV